MNESVKKAVKNLPQEKRPRCEVRAQCRSHFCPVESVRCGKHAELEKSHPFMEAK